MMIASKSGFMTRRLPYDAEIEYLKSTGTQWIDTGVVPTTATEVEATVMPTNQTEPRFMFGCRAYQGSNTYACLLHSSNRIGYRVGNGSFVYASNYSESGAIHKYGIANGVFYRDGAIVSNACAGASFSANNALALLAINTNGTPSQWFVGRLYSCKIWDNNILVRDFIPVRRGNVGYMYDRVTRKLFGNAGTGDFVLGPDVVPVEYIESHGTEWIDTGVTYNYESDIDIQANVARMTDNRAVIVGNYYDNAHSAFSLEFGGVANALTGRPRGYFRLGRESDSASLSLNSVPANTFVALGGRITASTRYAEVASAADSSSITLSSYAVINNGYSLKLFKDNRANTSAIAYGIKLATVQISQNDIPVHKFLPVRVGTDATSWEGAMMDVLTRRIYRNAGTGAFTYGNDLKYPIPVE